MASVVEHWTHTGPVHAPEDVPFEQIAREEVRAAATVADAAPLGLLGFATGTFTVSAIATGFFQPSTIPYAVPVVLVFAGLAQFLAGMWAFRRGDTLGATAFGAFGSFNVTFAAYELIMHPATIPGSATAAPVVGIWVACFSYISLMLCIAALRRSSVLGLVLLALAGTYGFLAADIFLGGGTIAMPIAGWCGIVSSILAFYMATALVINSENQMPVLPIGSMHPIAHNGHTATGTTVREPVH